MDIAQHVQPLSANDRIKAKGRDLAAVLGRPTEGIPKPVSHLWRQLAKLQRTRKRLQSLGLGECETSSIQIMRRHET